MPKNGFIHRLQNDDEGRDKLEDKWAANTYLEIYLIWIAAALTILIGLTIGYWLFH
jgi:hypothetical protein